MAPVSYFLCKFSILLLLAGVVKSAVVNSYLNPLTEPCYGAGNSKVRAITVDSLLSDCGDYVLCVNDITDQKETCPFDNPYFDAESGECVDHSDVCFKCPGTYELISVPNACQQFILCFNGKPLLSACQGNLVFDGRPGIHQCNYGPSELPTECFREDKDDFESKPCPNAAGKEPLFEAFDNKPGVYYVCYGDSKPLRLTCPIGLKFNKDLGACDIETHKTDSFHN
ncbi:uncharacterized protein LOC116343939 [Contarinia nasturtii]|uniref:uncharacterized protein LOC116343939 n=1 Tax=Contarinia nasturtii TaxID=265458 RepID=UPI0012D44ED3|nr:uncharacterized protein LOC116343939 [Contarinia nasturtii]